MNGNTDRPRQPGNLRRRQVLRAAAASTLLPTLLLSKRPGRAAEGDLPAPDLSDSQVQGFSACIRPYRRKTFRLEVEKLGRTILVHNYGHGGAGITLSWGSALEAADLLRKELPPPAEVAVLGAGVLGLTTAYCLLEQGYHVSVHARDFAPQLASNKAGGQWCPSYVEVEETDTAQERFARMLRRSHAEFRKRMGAEWGVAERPNYFEGFTAHGFEKVPKGVLAPPERFNRLPIRDARAGGVMYRTLLIEPPKYMSRLRDAVKARKGELHETTFNSRDEIAGLDQPAIVNCLGLGARALFNDELVVPVRGQIVLLKPQPLPYLIVHARGHMYPRDDVMFLGGTFEMGVDNPTPDPEACRRILERNRLFFGLA
jgi:glycine/D-amino acid oxidase-like deaminating enzyme